MLETMHGDAPRTGSAWAYHARSACRKSIMAAAADDAMCADASGRWRERADEHRASPLDPAIQEPVALEELVIPGRGADVRSRTARRARHEADALESLADAGPGEDGRAHDGLDEDARRVVRERDDGVRFGTPAEAPLEAVEQRRHQRVLLAVLVDAHPAFQGRHPLGLVVAELDRRGHDARRAPAELREDGCQEDARIAEPDVRERVGP